MLEFIQLLKQRYQAVLTQLGNESVKTSYQQRIDQLILAEAFIRKGQLIDASQKPLLQMAVVGPTQAGKSSLVNVLLNSNVAGVSPLAGYTIHPQGFCNGVSCCRIAAACNVISVVSSNCNKRSSAKTGTIAIR